MDMGLKLIWAKCFLKKINLERWIRKTTDWDWLKCFGVGKDFCKDEYLRSSDDRNEE